MQDSKDGSGGYGGQASWVDQSSRVPNYLTRNRLMFGQDQDDEHGEKDKGTCMAV